jgi:AraC-like DNA-binding protein
MVLKCKGANKVRHQQQVKKDIDSLKITKIKETGFHFNKTLKILFVLFGRVELITLDQYVVLNIGDVYVLNENELVSFLSSGSNSVLIAQLPLNTKGKDCCRFKQIHPLSVVDKKAHEEVVKGLVLPKNHQSLVAIMLRHQILFSEKSLSKKTIECSKCEDVLNYINQHYTTDISLKHLAEHFITDKYIISHKFRKYFGFSIYHYLKEVRLFHSACQLKSSTDKIMDVALDNGFPSLRAFNQSFKEKFGLPPLTFRKKDKVNQVMDEQEDLVPFFQIEQLTADIVDQHLLEKIKEQPYDLFG